MKKLLLPLLSCLILLSCKKKTTVDLIVHHATVYTVDSAFSVVNAFAVKDGKIVATGDYADLASTYEAKETMDAGGNYIYPGFNDGHSHFFRYGAGLKSVDLTGTTSWHEIVERVNAYAAVNKEGWIIGRGWDQNDWAVKEFPDNTELNKLFPSRPVVLTRIDGHAMLVNQAALDSANIVPNQKINGGVIGMKGKVLSGLLVDNAMGLLSTRIPQPSIKQMNEALLAAQANCFKVGLTSVTDCGLDYPLVSVIDALQQEGKLKMRMNVMLSDSKPNFDFLFKNGPVLNERLVVRSFKVYADGALGSRGAALIHDYTDKPGQRGLLLSSVQHFAEVAADIHKHKMQMCTHAIGDSANRVILNIYANTLKGKNDLRWRVEHAQVIDAADMHLFGENSIVPSVQPTHATSDMYWAVDRLGKSRLKGAYAYQDLLKQNGWEILGTDFPVENIDPLLTFYAAVVRKDLKGYPPGGFQPENALSRKQAILGMTVWPARGSFEEKIKGSLERGKFADFVVLDRDLMKAGAADLAKTHVVKTYSNGELVYAR